MEKDAFSQVLVDSCLRKFVCRDRGTHRQMTIKLREILRQFVFVGTKGGSWWNPSVWLKRVPSRCMCR